MKKEFKINITKSESSTNGHLLICVSIDKFLIGMFSMSKGGLCVSPRKEVSDLLGVYHGDFHSYLSIPEIKKLYDEHFNKEIDLFEFDGGYLIDIYGCVCTVEDIAKSYETYKNSNPVNKRIFMNGLAALLDENYNRFPTEELCEKARQMSLDERKQLLFAHAKGYEVLTREENNNNCFSVFYNCIDKLWSFHKDCTHNIYFTTSEHAIECAEFMNETKEVSE